jgi:hypothetical protein
LRSTARGAERGEMALRALEKAPFSATFSTIFPAFIRELAIDGAIGRERDLEMC